MDNFIGRVRKVDSLLRLDSFKIVRVDTITEKIGRAVEDSIYSKELERIETELNNAMISKNKDSIEFLKYEIDYMRKEVDSLTALIKNADTTKKYGVIVTSLYELRKNDKSQKDTAYFFIDIKGNILNSSMIDAFIQRGYERVK